MEKLLLILYGTWRLFRNLPYKITAEEMYDIFGKYGAIRQIRYLFIKSRASNKYNVQYMVIGSTLTYDYDYEQTRTTFEISLAKDSVTGYAV